VYTKFESYAVDTILWLRNQHLEDSAAKSQQRNDFPTDTGGLEVKLVVPQERQKQRLEDSFPKSQQQKELSPPLKERYNTTARGNIPLHFDDVHSGDWESMKRIYIQTPSTSSFEGTPIRVPEYQSLKSRTFRGTQEQSSSTDSRYDPVLPTLGTVLAVWFTNNKPLESDYYRIGRPRGHYHDNPMLLKRTNIHLESSLQRRFPLQDFEKSDLDVNFSLIARWLNECQDNHYFCKQMVSGEQFGSSEGAFSPLPTRVIDVGHEGQYPSLLVSDGQVRSYIALSHRWGNIIDLFRTRTTKKTLKRHMQRLRMWELPKTFQDAIIVCRKLNVRYLWIDSLCIIQDDLKDWEREAKQMGSIFEKAICTIAAVDALDEDDVTDNGLFLPSKRHIFHVEIPIPTHDGMKSAISLRPFPLSFKTGIE
jgi:hypothetical protein